MPIDRDLLYQDELTWLPSGNSLTEDQMRAINELIISQVGDDESKTPEVLCKGLRAIGYANVGKSSTATGVKRERIGQHEKEYFDGASSTNAWPTFIDNLKNICPLFGYSGLSATQGGAIRIRNDDPPFDPNPMPC